VPKAKITTAPDITALPNPAGTSTTQVATGPVANTTPFYNVLNYPNVTGAGTDSDTDGINAVIQLAAQSSGSNIGSVVFLPAGRYLLGSPGLQLPDGITLQGVGWNMPSNESAPRLGTWLIVEQGESFSPVNVTGSGAAVRNIAFMVQNQPGNADPPPADPMISVEGQANQVLLEDLFLYNPYCGVNVSGAAQLVIRRLFGQPLNYGIQIDSSEDTNYIDSVHFWTYWSTIPPSGPLPPPALYQRVNGVAMRLLRCDNPHISNFFAFNYNVGLALAVSPQPGENMIPHKVHLMNADFDGCVTGIDVSAPGTSSSSTGLQMSNVTIQAPSGSGAPSGHGIWVEPAASWTIIQASNLRISRSGLDAIRIDANNAKFYGENVSLENWQSGNGFFISQLSSFAYLGVGLAYSSQEIPCVPPSQFRLAAVNPTG
jgi:hypothetical protein